MDDGKVDRLGGAVIFAVSLLTVVGGLGSTDLAHMPLRGRTLPQFGFSGTTSSEAALIGGLLAALSSIRVASAIGIYRHSRWGLVVAAVTSLLSAILCLLHQPSHRPVRYCPEPPHPSLVPLEARHNRQNARITAIGGPRG